MPSRRKTEAHQVALEPFNIGPKGQRIPRCQFVRYGKHPKAGLQCKGNAIRGARMCRTHGGKGNQRIGPLAPNWKGGVSKQGRWTEMLSGHLRDSYIRALADPQVLSLEGELALIDVRLEELVKRANAHYDMGRAREHAHGLVAAIKSSDANGITMHATALLEVVDGQFESDRAWHSVMVLTDRRRSLVESERKRLIEQNMFMPREQVHAYGAALMGIVTRHVKDRDTLVAIVTDFKAVSDAGLLRSEE